MPFSPGPINFNLGVVQMDKWPVTFETESRLQGHKVMQVDMRSTRHCITILTKTGICFDKVDKTPHYQISCNHYYHSRVVTADRLTDK
jgi:hypothetical protein